MHEIYLEYRVALVAWSYILTASSGIFASWRRACENTQSKVDCNILYPWHWFLRLCWRKTYINLYIINIHEYYICTQQRGSGASFFSSEWNTKAVILVGNARARYFALWHVVRSQATGTGVPLRIFQMSPADDRLWNEGRGICSWLGPWKLCLWQKTEFMWWFSLMYAIRNHSCIFILLNEKTWGWLIRWRTDVSEWN